MSPVPTPPTTAETARLTQLVLQCHPRQKLFLLGTTAVRRGKSQISKSQIPKSAGQQPGCHYTAHYFLLSLVREGQGVQPVGLRGPQTDRLREPQADDSLAALQDKIENTLAAHFGPCTVLVLNINRFNRWLIDGHPFAWTIVNKATLLHDNGYLVDTDIPVTPRYPSKDDIIRNTAFKRRMAKQFFDGASFYRQKGTTDLAAFMLHQCAEQCLRSLLFTTTGYDPNTHNIDKLVRYCSMAVHKVAEIFNMHNEENKRVYSLLRRAYIDARYNSYVVMDGDLEVMMGKGKELMKLLRSMGGVS